MTHISNKLIPTGLVGFCTKMAAVGSSMVMASAYAANDLPGGPGVNQLNLPTGVTKIAQEQSWLHWYMMIICTVIFLAVFSVMFYSIWKHRKSVGHKPANFHESVTVEIVWTIIPFIIVNGSGAMITSKVREKALALYPPLMRLTAKCLKLVVPKAVKPWTTIC
jgi:heme/copper-type cytochrome/quinol oxidase subunit 2